MEARSLHTAADRAMRSCILLRSRLASLAPSARHFSTSSPVQHPETRARWESQPPPAPRPLQGRMPFKLRSTTQPIFKVIADDEAGNAALDGMYARFLGRGGELLLPRELKWLAITHKSFDHGWQGNNDRLAFLGKRVVDVQVSLALLSMPRLRQWGEEEMGQLSGLENISPEAKQRVSERRRIASLAREMGIADVMRWKPRNTNDLQSSGVDTVLAHTLYSIIGALTLHRGSAATTQLVKERILSPLGLKM